MSEDYFAVILVKVLRVFLKDRCGIYVGLNYKVDQLIVDQLMPLHLAFHHIKHSFSNYYINIFNINSTNI